MRPNRRKEGESGAGSRGEGLDSYQGVYERVKPRSFLTGLIYPMSDRAQPSLGFARSVLENSGVLRRLDSESKVDTGGVSLAVILGDER